MVEWPIKGKAIEVYQSSGYGGGMVYKKEGWPYIVRAIVVDWTS